MFFELLRVMSLAVSMNGTMAEFQVPPFVVLHFWPLAEVTGTDGLVTRRR
jgi:hypothetical protein